MLNKRAGFPLKRKGTGDKKETLRLKAKVSLVRIMKQDLTIITLENEFMKDHTFKKRVLTDLKDAILKLTYKLRLRIMQSNINNERFFSPGS